MNMTEIPEKYNAELLENFVDESREAFDEIESILVRFEHEKVDDDLLNIFIHRLHSITSILGIGGYDEAAAFCKSILAILEDIKIGTFPFSEKLNDIIMMSIDHLRRATEEIFTGKPLVDDHLDLVKQALVALRAGGDADLDSRIMEASNAIYLEIQEDQSVFVEPPVNKDSEIDLSSVVATTQSTDMSYFRDLMCKIEECNPNWIGRGDKILNLCMSMNREAGYPINARQLEAAVLMHDFGMTFLSSSPLNKEGELNELERRKMQEHPLLGAELLYRIGNWDEAAKMVMQHHEREDGLGYPEKISGSSICDGAKILAIADTLVAMTIKQSYRDYRRPVMRAIIEINSCKGVQFSEYWVDIFNTVIKSYKKIIVDKEEYQMLVAG